MKTDEKIKIDSLIEKEYSHLDKILTNEDVEDFKKLRNELKDTWSKKQIFRTETEMRIAVIDDGRYPTKASKYWQAVREQSVFFENLMSLSFDYRRNDIRIKKLQRKLDNETDDLQRELLQVSLDEKIFAKASMEQTAKDRMREIKLWSKIKSEIDDGTFDNKNVNTHQKDSYKYILENRFNNITPNTSYSEKFNITSQLSTINRVRSEGILENKNKNTLKINVKKDKNINTK